MYGIEQSFRVEGVILAAGLSTRAKTFKMSLDFHGRSLLERAVLSMNGVCDRIVVVAGYRGDKILSLMSSYEKVKVVVNSEYERGMFSSVKTGISQMEGDFFFLLPGDYPLVNAGTYKKLLTAQDEISIPVYRGRKGHPVLIKATLKGQIMEWPDNSSLRDFIHHRGYVGVDVDDPGILRDVDTIDDYNDIKLGTEVYNEQSSE